MIIKSNKRSTRPTAALQRLRTMATAMIAFSAISHTQLASAADWIVSANDGKYQRVLGADTYLANPPTDSLVLLDASQFPPKRMETLPVENGIQGPPQAVAVTPDGTLAFVAAPTRYDPVQKKLLMDSFLQVVQLTGPDVGTIDKIELGSHPQAIAVSPNQALALVTCVDGSLHVFKIDGPQVHEVDVLKLGEKRLAGISFTHDGRHALVSLRDEQGVVVLNVDGEKVSDSGDRISTGVAPYTIDVSGDNHWAVVSNVGLAGLASYKGRLLGDADTITLIDVSHTPFKAVQQISVPSLPEGVAISPDGKWIAVQAMDGSNLTADNPNRRSHGKLDLFAIRNGQAVKVSEIAGGEASQGIVFTKDSRHVIVQFNVERQLAFFTVQNGRLVDSGQRMPLAAAPSSLRSAPR